MLDWGNPDESATLTACAWKPEPETMWSPNIFGAVWVWQNAFVVVFSEDGVGRAFASARDTMFSNLLGCHNVVHP
jgi:hypothetical protein